MKTQKNKLLFLVLAASLLSACTSTDGPPKCTLHDDTWRKAIALYRQALFEEAIAMTEATPCPPKDKQLIINSYMGLYLLKPTPKLEARSRAAIRELSPHEYGLPDIGFLLVTLNDFGAARSFYESQLASLQSARPQGMKETSRLEIERRLQGAIKILDDPRWTQENKMNLLWALQRTLSGKTK
ncbi:hypothetical protein [Pinirhizobacter sp.]|jgi:hypothetical protein|uniref:hypothetical protein n=1 Tax=Pinirhizobacter sp. TaxID=2950432 RepID=UPI002F4298DE